MKANTLFRYALTAVLSVVALLPLSAQDAEPAQDALYIYRNDGQFNGFFYDDIERIEFSRIDTLGVEHQDYVVQEVYALDSVFRIPISAIDSVAFITPKTIYQEGVVTPQSDLWSYVVSSDTVSLFTLAASTPSALVPKVGDKLANNSATPYLPYGFFGKVASVTNSAEGIVVTAEAAEPEELFQQYVAKVAGESPDWDGGEGAPRRSSRRVGSSELQTVDIDEYTIDIEMDRLAAMYPSAIIFSGKGSVYCSFKPKVSYRAFASVGLTTGSVYDLNLRVEMATQFNIRAVGTLMLRSDAPLSPKLSLPLGLGFTLDAVYGMSGSMSGTVDIDSKTYEHSSNSASAQFTHDVYNLTEGKDFMDGQLSMVAKEYEFSQSLTLKGKYTFQAGLYTTFGLSFLKVASLSARVDAGARITADIEYDESEVTGTAPDVIPASYSTGGLYNQLNRDGSVQVAAFCTGKAIAGLGDLSKWKLTYDVFNVSSKPAFSGALVPKFSNVQGQYDKDKRLATLSADVGRNVLFSTPIGFALYDKSGHRVAGPLWNATEYIDSVPRSYSLTVSGLPDGQYTVYPVTKAIGTEMLASPTATFYAGEQVLTVSTDKVVVPNAGGTATVEVTNTISEQTTVTPGDGYGKWWTCTQDGDKYQITVQKNETGADRQSTLTFSATNEQDPTLTDTKVVAIRQTDNEELTGLVLKEMKTTSVQHDPATSDEIWVYVTYGEGKRHEFFGSSVLVDGYLNDDILEVFQKNKNFEPDATGAFAASKNGLTLNGQFADYHAGQRPQSGSGTFTIDTSYDYNLKTADELASWYRDGSHLLEKINLMLNGTMKHKLTGTFTLEWSDSEGAYVIHLKGTGTYALDCVYYDGVANMVVEVDDYGEYVDCSQFGVHPDATVNSTQRMTLSGTTDIDFQLTYDLVE